jgi:hypothetical protein
MYRLQRMFEEMSCRRHQRRSKKTVRDRSGKMHQMRRIARALPFRVAVEKK